MPKNLKTISYSRRVSINISSSHNAKIASYFAAFLLDHQLTEILVPLSLNIQAALSIVCQNSHAQPFSNEYYSLR